MLMTKRDKNDTVNAKTTSSRNEEYELIQSLRKSLNEGRERENMLRSRIETL